MSKKALRAGPKRIDRKVHPKAGRRKGEKGKMWIRRFTRPDGSLAKT